LRDNCYLYFAKKGTDCQIPCKLEPCSRELHHFIDCPVWSCIPTTSTTTTSTTTASTTTTSTTTTTIQTTATTTTTAKPVPIIPIPIDHPTVIYSSIAINVVLLFTLIVVFYYKCKKCTLRRIRNFRNRNERSENARPHLRIDSVLDNEIDSILSNANSGPQNVTGTIPRINPRTRQPYYSLAESSSEDFSPPLQDIDLNSPRVPSFLNTPLATPKENPDYFFMFKKCLPKHSADSSEEQSLLPKESVSMSTFPQNYSGNHSQTFKPAKESASGKPKPPKVPTRSSSRLSGETTL
jgi:hypothetical protein